MLSLTAWLNEHGGEARFEALEGLRHSQATQAAFTDNRLQWVFAHRKQQQKEADNYSNECYVVKE